MRLYGTRSTQETVEVALRRLVGSRLGAEEALALEGSGWEGDLHLILEVRCGSPPGWALVPGVTSIIESQWKM